MRLVNLTTSKKSKLTVCFKPGFAVILCFCFSRVSAQDNSPYSRYGIGDLVPSTHIIGRGMGSLSAGIVDYSGLSINFNNPATYGSFQTLKELKSKKIASGR